MPEVLDPAIEAAIRRHVGSLEFVEGIEERVARLIEPAAVALEIAMERLGEIVMSDSSSKAGDESTTRTDGDRKAAEGLVARLSTFLATSSSVTLTPAIEALIEEAQADAEAVDITSVRSTVSDSRPG